MLKGEGRNAEANELLARRMQGFHRSAGGLRRSVCEDGLFHFVSRSFFIF